MCVLSIVLVYIQWIRYKQCSKCHTLEFDWWPEDDLAEDKILPYICTRCVDQEKILIAAKWFMVLHRTRFPPEVFHFLFPTNWAQWSYLNSCQRSQRVQNFRQLLMGAPYTQNDIYSLHYMFEEQIRQGHRWRGKVYRTTCWDRNTDLIEFLI